MFVGSCIILIVEYRETNLMSLALLFLYLMLNMFRIHPSSGACDLFVELFHGLYCSGSMCVGVTLWFGWGGVVSVCRLRHYLMLNMFRISIHPYSWACDLFVELFRGLYCSGSKCVGVTLWFGSGGVVSVCRLQPAYGYPTTPTKPQRNTNTHRTRAIQPMK